MYRVRKALLVPALLSAAFALSACGSSDTSAGSSSGTQMDSMGSPSATPAATTAAATPTSEPEATGPHNLADVDFARLMIPHHAQAIEMARVVLKRTDNAQVKALASRIEAAQTPEISTLSGWLTSWGAPVPDTSMPMGSEMQMGGMMSHADMRKLAKASAAKVDALFLAQMTKHHRGAIAMAGIELADGSNPQAKALAASIKKAQTAEVSEMKTLLASIS